MTICKPIELTRELTRNARVLGLDLGTRTIGLALSDVGRTIATPFDTIARTKLVPDLARLKKVTEAEDVGALVLGLPINMDGSEGPRCQATHQFAVDLLKVMELPLTFWDERLSTRAAESALLDADMSRKRRAEVIDKVAAAVILQGFLDFRAASKAGGAD